MEIKKGPVQEGAFKLQIDGSERRRCLTKETNYNWHRNREVQGVSEKKPHSSSMSLARLQMTKIVLEADSLLCEVKK